MSNYYQNNTVFNVNGYEIYFTRFADSIIQHHFPDSLTDLKSILQEFTIEENLLWASGGGRHPITKNLANKLENKGWTKKVIESTSLVEGKMTSSKSHEVDHIKSFSQGVVGLEIEWNNKDPFYDRDLENFKGLHQIGYLSFGVIITRGKTLQESLKQTYRDYIESLDRTDLEKFIKILPDLSDKAKIKIRETANKPGISPDKFLDEVATQLCNSKYGTATTHMDKLLTRIGRGVGNPCPLILIGIGKDRVIK